MSKYLYIFLDESGDFNFARNGTRYFLLTSVTKERPFEAFRDLHDLVERAADVKNISMLRG